VRPKYEGSRFLRNVGSHLWEHTTAVFSIPYYWQRLEIFITYFPLSNSIYQCPSWKADSLSVTIVYSCILIIRFACSLLTRKSREIILSMYTFRVLVLNGNGSEYFMKRVMLMYFKSFSIHRSQWDPALSVISVLHYCYIRLLKLSIKISRFMGVIIVSLKLCLLYWLYINTSAWVLFCFDIVLSFKLLIWLLYLGSVTAGGGVHIPFPEAFRRAVSVVAFFQCTVTTVTDTVQIEL
jgi:hypothetical protein